jgi:nucleotidyltransferase/DNA polymerase involved in DNA repair
MAVQDSARDEADTDSDSGSGTPASAAAALQADLNSPLRALGPVSLGKKNTSGILSAPKGTLHAEGIEVAEEAADRPEFQAFHHAGLGLLIYDLRGEFSRGMDR